MGNGDARDLTGNKLAEIELLIKAFKEKFEAGTSDAENFMTMYEIEQLWSELQNGTNNVISSKQADAATSRRSWNHSGTKIRTTASSISMTVFQTA
jgi:hypothetical protein